MAAALAADGVGPGERVAFLDRNGIEFFEVFFGCALLGAVSVAVNWRLAPPEMAAIIEDAGATVLFYGPDYEVGRREFDAGGHHRPALRPVDRVRRLARRRHAGPVPPTPGSSRGPTTSSPSSTRRGRPGCPRAS